ncbi:MAG TPA: hypothetical protein VM146_17085 [Steroidobacteraceae bacterium]|nr:hypothetical protein [Steroidobacteraceae bacterium]
MSYLDTGIYTIPVAARLLGVSQAKVRGWVSGYHHSHSAAVVRNELGVVGHRVALSFKNLIEGLFIKGFSEHFSIQAIRHMVVQARSLLDDEHPFARHIEFSTDKRSIFAKIVRAGMEAELVNLRSRNLAMEEIMRPFLTNTVMYGQVYAKQWHPRPDDAPNVFLAPNVAFGQPVIERVPTRALFDAVKAERGDFDTVARWYELPVSAVKEAHSFQKRFAVH